MTVILTTGVEQMELVAHSFVGFSSSSRPFSPGRFGCLGRLEKEERKRLDKKGRKRPKSRFKVDFLVGNVTTRFSFVENRGFGLVRVVVRHKIRKKVGAPFDAVFLLSIATADLDAFFFPASQSFCTH